MNRSVTLFLPSLAFLGLVLALHAVHSCRGDLCPASSAAIRANLSLGLLAPSPSPGGPSAV